MYAVDDEPVHGPDAYFILHGFQEAEIISQLATIGLRVHAVIKIGVSKQFEEGNCF